MSNINKSLELSKHIIKTYSISRIVLITILFLLCMIACATLPNKTVVGTAFHISQQQEKILINKNLMVAKDRELFLAEYDFNKKLCEDIMGHGFYYTQPLKNSALEEYLTNLSENYEFLIHKYKF